MQKNKILKIQGIILLIGFVFVGFSYGILVTNKSISSVNIRSNHFSNVSNKIGKSESYIVTSPFFINGNSQISPHSSQGNGSVNDPYIIEGLNITYSGGTLIQIQNTTAYITIRNNYLDGKDTTLSIAFDFTNCSNINVDNNIIVDVSQVIYGINLTNIFYQNNNFQSTFFQNYGIVLFEANSSTISNNIFSINGGTAIDIGQGFHNSITNNFIAGSTNAIFTSLNYYDTINYNQITNSSTSIFLKFSFNSTIDSNTIKSLGPDGIFLFHSNFNTIFNNTVKGPDKLIDIQYSTSSSVLENRMINGVQNAIAIDYWSNDSIVTDNYISNSTVSVEITLGFRNIFEGIDIINTKTESGGISLSQSNFNSFSNINITNTNMDVELVDSDWNNFSLVNLISGKGNGTQLINANFNTFANCNISSSFDFGFDLFNGTGNRIISNTFYEAKYYELFLMQEQGDIVQHNFFMGKGHYSGTQAFDNGKNDLFLNNYYTGFTSPDTDGNGIVDNPVLIDGPSHVQDMAPLATINGQSGNSSNNLVTVTVIASSSSQPKNSPGFSVFELFLGFSFLAFIFLLKRKKFSL